MNIKNRVGVKEVAERFGVTLRCVYKWVQSGKIPHIKISHRCVRFDPDKLDEWEAARTVDAS